jgi:hypothetical protein
MTEDLIDWAYMVSMWRLGAEGWSGGWKEEDGPGMGTGSESERRKMRRDQKKWGVRWTDRVGCEPRAARCCRCCRGRWRHRGVDRESYWSRRGPGMPERG